MFQLGFKWGSLRLKYVPVNNCIGFLIPSKTDQAYTMITKFCTSPMSKMTQIGKTSHKLPATKLNYHPRP